MSLFAKFQSFLRNALSSGRADSDLHREIHSHLGMLSDEKLRLGMPQHEAQRAASIELGGIEQVKERVREQRFGNWAQSVRADCRFALRQLHKNWSFTAIAVLTLALGIGAATAIFSVIYGVLIRPLAVPDAQQVVQVVARLEPHLRFAEASSQFDALSQSFRDRYLEGESKVQSVGLSSVQQVMSASVRTYLWIHLAAVAFLLLIACSNVSNLLLARGAARSKEVAVRAAMGASRNRLIRQFLCESLVLSALGCLFGFAVARLALFWLLRSAPTQLPRVTEIRVDGWAFVFSLAVTIFAAAFSAMIPSLHSAKLDVQPILKESSAQSSASRGRGVFRGALVVAEIALSIILLIGALLLAQTFVNLLRVHPGFEPNGVLSAEIWLTGSRYHSTAELNGFYDNLEKRLRQLPGVQQTAVVSMGQPLERGGNDALAVNGVGKGSMDVRVVTRDYFQTLCIAIQQGRDFSRADSANGEPVAIVNEAFVRQFLNGGDLFGSSVKIENEKDLPRRIVGIAADVKSYVHLPEGPTVFFPARQADFALISAFDVWFPTHILVRTTGDPRLLANAVDRTIRETDSLTMDQVLARSLAIQRFMMVVVAVFAVLALLLAAIGIYGVISFSVSQRTQEFGIRMALGADTYSVLGLVLRQAARLALVGVAIGILGAAALQQAIASVLFGVHLTDAATIAVSAVGLLGVVTLACCVPARRASRVDPTVALRYE
jgi:putative ABC transport system permease protein